MPMLNSNTNNSTLFCIHFFSRHFPSRKYHTISLPVCHINIFPENSNIIVSAYHTTLALRALSLFSHSFVYWIFQLAHCTNISCKASTGQGIRFHTIVQLAARREWIQFNKIFARFDSNDSGWLDISIHTCLN